MEPGTAGSSRDVAWTDLGHCRPTRYGSTTFSLRLLARHTSDDAELIRLEADWDRKVGKLPLERNRATNWTCKILTMTGSTALSSTVSGNTPRIWRHSGYSWS